MRVIFLVIPILVLSCKLKPEFEKSKTIAQNQWQSNIAATGTLSISDTNKLYNLFTVIRHTDAYAYNNIWLQVTCTNNKQQIFNNKVEMPLANDAVGWFGIGMNDIWEHRYKINTTPIKFSTLGNYNFSVQQIMRDNPLLHVVSAGLRVEQININ
jgi:gliding motility-associated lipoprotein GldH